MVAEDKKADYIMDTLEIIKRCLRGKRDYFRVTLFVESHKPASCGCKDPTPEDPYLPVYEYDIFIEVKDDTPKEKIRLLKPISGKQDEFYGVHELLLIKILTTNNNMDIVENSDESSTVTHLSLENYISIYLNGVLRDFTGIEF